MSIASDDEDGGTPISQEALIEAIRTKSFVPITKGYVSFDSDKGRYNKETGKVDFIAPFMPLHGAIVYPSFGAPLVIEPNQPLTFFMLVNEELGDWDHPKINKKRINLQLYHSAWEDRIIHKADYKELMPHSIKFFDALYPEEIYKNISYSKPEHIINKAEVLLLDENNHTVGRLQPHTLKTFFEEKLEYLIRVTIRNHGLTEGMHNLSFLGVISLKVIQDTCGPYKLIRHLQDELTLKNLKAYRSKLEFGYKIDDEGEFGFEVDESDPIQTYHPVYVTNKPKLNVGHLTDVHVSSRQELLKKNKIQIIPGAPVDISPPIGEQLLSTYDSLKDLMDQMGQDSRIDLLFITGDLIDFNLNLDPHAIDNYHQLSTNEIWKLLKLQVNFDKKYPDKKVAEKLAKNTDKPENELELSHTPAIDEIIVYSLMRYYYDKYKKPIFVTSGNHDSYGYPYGISPRFRDTIALEAPAAEGRKADELWASRRLNPGIPMDHNLTVQEAILIFGPGFSNVVKNSNFDDRHSATFYSLFSSVTDFSFSYKTQTFTGLDWGVSETTPLHKAHQLDFLPRAKSSLTGVQIKILEDAVCRSKELNGPNMVFTHAPVVNFRPHVPIKTHDVKKLIDQCVYYDRFGDLSKSTKYDSGSFLWGREVFYSMIARGEITHTLSGHSHRLALYGCEGTYTFFSEKECTDASFMRAQGFPIDTLGPPQDLGAVLSGEYLADTEKTCIMPPHKRTRIILTGSGGPIPIKNDHGEMRGVGLDMPHGTAVIFDGEKDYLKVYTAQHKNAKPRFAAALDAFDLFERRVFKTFMTPPGSDLFHVELDKRLPDVNFIESISIFVLNEKGQLEGQFNFELICNNIKSYIYKFQNLKDIIPSIISEEYKLYLVIKLNDNLSTMFGYKQYDYTSPWIIRSQLFQTIRSRLSEPEYFIKRHKKFGEIPEWGNYGTKK